MRIRDRLVYILIAIERYISCDRGVNTREQSVIELVIFMAF